MLFNESDKFNDMINLENATVEETTYSDYLGSESVNTVKPLDFDGLANKIATAKTIGNNNIMLIGQTLKEARDLLTKKQFTQFLKDARVNYKITQAKKVSSYYTYINKLEDKDIQKLQGLGVEKVYKLQQVEDQEQQEQLQELLLIDDSISVGTLSKVVKRLNEDSSLMADEVLDLVKTMPKPEKQTIDKEDVVSVSDYEALQANLENCQKQLEESNLKCQRLERELAELQEENNKLNSELEERKSSFSIPRPVSQNQNSPNSTTSINRGNLFAQQPINRYSNINHI